MDQSSYWSRALAVFALLAFAVRALTPAGYMLSPAQQPGRFIEVTLCAAHGAVSGFLDRQTGDILPDKPRPAHDNGADKNAGPCVFAAAAHIAPPQPAPALPTHYVRFETARFRDRESASVRGLAAPPPWSTGPPQAA